jgi:hypothetical protein
MKRSEKIFDIITGEENIIERNETPGEKLERENAELRQAAIIEHQAQAEAKATARAEILNRLGLTADEAAILLG